MISISAKLVPFVKKITCSHKYIMIEKTPHRTRGHCVLFYM